VKKILFILILSCALGSIAQAQTMLYGVVLDSATNTPMSKVSINNLTSKDGVLTDFRGRFAIEVKDDQYLKISYVGYNWQSVHIDEVKNFDFLTIKLSFKKNILQDVTIERQLTLYQKDSLRRAELYKDVLEYKQEKSIEAPVSSLYQQFSKKYKDLRKFKQQAKDMERQNFIDTKYQPETVQKITGLEGDALAFFMNDHPMEYDFARTASELEIRWWIKSTWEQYKKEKGGQY
jgi:hypothetical protein